MKAVQRPVFEGRIPSAGGIAFVDCPYDVETWCVVQPWGANKLAPTAGALALGAGVYTQSGNGDGVGPNVTIAYLVIPFGVIASTEASSTTTPCLNPVQIMPGHRLALVNSSDADINARVWCTPRLVLTSETVRVSR